MDINRIRLRVGEYEISIVQGEGMYNHGIDNAEVAVFSPNINHRWATKKVWKQVFDRDLDDDVVGFIGAGMLADLINGILKGEKHAESNI